MSRMASRGVKWSPAVSLSPSWQRKDSSPSKPVIKKRREVISTEQPRINYSQYYPPYSIRACAIECAVVAEGCTFIGGIGVGLAVCSLSVFLMPRG